MCILDNFSLQQVEYINKIPNYTTINALLCHTLDDCSTAIEVSFSVRKGYEEIMSLLCAVRTAYAEAKEYIVSDYTYTQGKRYFDYIVESLNITENEIVDNLHTISKHEFFYTLPI